MPNINENLDASFKFKPMNRAAVIAVPDLDAPGINAKHCTSPKEELSCWLHCHKQNMHLANVFCH